MIGGSGGSGGCLATRSTTVPNSQFKYSVQQVENGDASGNSLVAAQRIEAANIRPYIGKTMTLSLWLRFTGFLPVPQLIISTPTNVAEDSWQTNEPLGEVNQFTYLPSVTLGVWTRVSYSFVVPAAAVNGLQVMLATQAYTGTPTMNHTGWMLTEGPAAPANFYRAGKTIQDEMAMCQRYAVNPQLDDSGSSASYGTGAARSATEARIMIPLPVTMREPPSLDASSSAASNFALITAAGATQAATAIAVSTTGTGHTMVHLTVNTAAGLVAGGSTYLFKVGATNKLLFTAEL